MTAVLRSLMPVLRVRRKHTLSRELVEFILRARIRYHRATIGFPSAAHLLANTCAYYDGGKLDPYGQRHGTYRWNSAESGIFMCEETVAINPLFTGPFPFDSVPAGAYRQWWPNGVLRRVRPAHHPLEAQLHWDEHGVPRRRSDRLRAGYISKQTHHSIWSVGRHAMFTRDANTGVWTAFPP